MNDNDNDMKTLFYLWSWDQEVKEPIFQNDMPDTYRKHTDGRIVQRQESLTGQLMR